MVLKCSVPTINFSAYIENLNFNERRFVIIFKLFSFCNHTSAPCDALSGSRVGCVRWNTGPNLRIPIAFNMLNYRIDQGVCVFLFAAAEHWRIIAARLRGCGCVIARHIPYQTPPIQAPQILSNPQLGSDFRCREWISIQRSTYVREWCLFSFVNWSNCFSVNKFKRSFN